MIVELAASCRDALADGAVERHVGKGAPGEIRADHRPRAAQLRIVAGVEHAAGEHGNLERREDVAADDPLLDVEPAGAW